MKKIILIISLFVFFKGWSQDVHFSQFSQTPQLINPASAGMFHGKVRGILNYRNQWGALGQAYKTYAVSVDAPLLKPSRGNKAYLGLGANFYKDVAGDSNFGSFLGGVSISGILPISNSHKLAVGMQAGFGQYSASLSGLTWGNQFNGTGFNTNINSNETIVNTSAGYFDLGAGILYEFKSVAAQFLGDEITSFNVGVAGYHLNEPNYNFLQGNQDNIPMKLVAQFSGTFQLGGTKAALVPSVFYAIQGSYSEITLGMLLKIKFGGQTKYSGLLKQSSISFGTHFRLSDAFIPQVYLEFSDYMIGFSYDYNNSNLSRAAGTVGGFEISIRYISRPKAIQKSAFK